MADLSAVIGEAIAGVESISEGGDDAGNDSSTEGSSVSETSQDTTAAESAGSDSDAEGTGETGGNRESSSADKTTSDADKPVTAPVLDAIDKVLEAEGIKRIAGERENRIPYSRVKKIVQNEGKRLTTEFEAKTKAQETEYATHKTKAGQLDLVDKMIANDPDRYMRTLALLHPGKYDKYLNPEAPAAKKPATDPNADKPQPDYKFEDGTMGYTAAQHEKLMDWNRAAAKREAIEEVTKRYKPIEDRFLAEQQQAQFKPQVDAQLDRARKTWGLLFEEDYKKAGEGKSEILAYMQANPEVPFGDAVAIVLHPKSQAKLSTDRTKVREEVMGELNARPRAAAKVVPSNSKSNDSDSSGPKSLEDIIREATAGLG